MPTYTCTTTHRGHRKPCFRVYEDGRLRIVCYSVPHLVRYLGYIGLTLSDVS